ncbi:MULTISPECIES: LysR family transcriptional regulator [unclassified Halomonas]|uniref:LysR family transcriptional regulator n=1 Tax=unclassified Halomonas TaxID=2609666 RepID=UPI0021E4617D|nr:MULTISPECIES: LysR family transcriptional regulator [unclassified Halomonas]UYG01309.1 LysR family transcriptional regulator [Halomonas sp. GD1P12]WNL37634.1 LysR family transcriptional regulator [Halomonas sp. PAMB 3232]WNL40948.1 LysR family transcriptional regulator [Halomonas sp. PAMB 3264]
MEIRWLEDFIALARTRHFSRAADEQHVTQPTFSRRIKLLEEEMGATLINRQTLPLSLTPAGEEFLTLCEQITDRVRLTRDRVQEISAGEQRRIMLAAPQSLLSRFMPEWLEGLGWQHQVQPYLRATGWAASDYFQALGRAECDLAICYWPTGRFDPDIDTSACVYRVIGTERLIPVIAASLTHQPGAQLPGSPTKPVRWLAYPKRSLLGGAIKAHLARLSHSSYLSAQSDNLFAANIKELVLLGYGMGWLPERNVSAELESGALVRAGDTRFDVSTELRLYRHQKKHHAELERLWSELPALHV